MVSYPAINLVSLIIDEVSLEGLDGITLEALWLRLAHRLHHPLPLPKPLMVQIWSICVMIRDFGFYELETAREPLVIFDRYEFVDPDLGIILEPEVIPPDIYPHSPVHDVANGIIGSCSTYNTRKEVSEIVKRLSLNEVIEKYGQKLVIVATQFARNHALMGDDVSPTLQLNVTQYCFLERVGRSRYHGEVTQGKLSLNALKEDPKSLFYHRKFLLRHKLITKQLHHQKTGGHSCNGSLLHLPRFFVERKPKVIFLAEEVVKILKTKPNGVAEYDEIKRKLQIENAIKKLFKTSFFQKVVKTDIRAPYRTLYPNAKPTEWQQKNNPAKEKMIKVVQLVVPDIDIMEVWSKDEAQEDDEPQELSISNHKYCKPFMAQANAVIEDAGNEGVSQGSFARDLGLTKLQSRTILRNMTKANIVATYMNDIGRQRLTKFVSKRFEKGSKMSKEFKKEMHKIKELTKHIVIENNDAEKDKMIVKEERDIVLSDQENIVEDTTKSDVINIDNEHNYTLKTQDVSGVHTKELQKIFYVVNRILYKYHLTKRANRYKRTFSNYYLNMINKKQVEEKDKDTDDELLQISELSKNERTAAAYRNIKVALKVLTSENTNKSEPGIFGFMEDVQNNEKKNISNITYRLLRRANMIIESVKEHQVIDDMTKLMKMIHEEEDKEGYDVKIDKKSLVRLLQKLGKDNLVKNIKLSLSGNGREKHLSFICDPNIDINDAVIQSAVEQAKLKFFLISSQRCRTSSKKSTESLKSNTDGVTKKGEDRSIPKSKTLATTDKCFSKDSKKYGYSPKFVRMQVLHVFLFYLVYEHPGKPTLSKAQQIQALRDKGFTITDEIAKECNMIYNTEISWKMFVPPLPKYGGWPHGWTLMCDVLLRLPLSTFLKIHYISFVLPELDKYLNHPIRKHYLVKDLPVDIRNSLLYARKYIFNIHETITRLCYIGLVQFGPQRLKEKDQVFIYVNRRTELMDTTSSAPNYHIIENKSYPVTKYNFNEIQVVEKYWYDMWNTCINTPLGGRLVVQGTDIVLEDLSKKSEMIEAVIAHAPEDAERFDTGKVPGDRKGAAGIDSACFAHLKRNWNWGISNFPQKTKNQKDVVYERDTYLSNIKAKPLKFTDFSGLKKVSGPLPVNATDLKKKAKGKNDENTNQQKKYEALIGIRSAKQKSFVRRVLPRKCPSRRRTKYDEIDYRALQRMHKLRVDWDSHEDKILLVCKVAMMYLFPNPRKQVITFTAVRDVLRIYSFSSYNKTSRACQRRLLYMLRKQQTIDSVALGVEEIKQNFYIRNRFDGIVDRLKEEHKNPNEYEKQVIETFKSLVAYIAKKYYDISDAGPKEPLPVPMTVQEFNLFYKVVHPSKSFGQRGFTKDVRSTNDIHSAVINSVIHSSMCCGKDRRSWAYQLFKVYQQYPEMLLRNAMTKIRSDQMVTLKKNHLTTLRKYGNYMPMSSSQYQLSVNYMYKFQTRWPYDIFKESYDVFFKLGTWYCQNQVMNNATKLSDNFNGIETLPVTGGVVGTIHDYVMKDQIDFDVEIPDQVIVLDPRLKETDETYFRIAKRYQDVLASLDHMKYVRESSLQGGNAINSDVNDSKDNHTGFDNIHNVDAKSDKDGFSDLDDGGKRNFEDEKNFADYNDLNFDSDEENSHNVADDENNVIKFQDGTKIVLHKDDVKCSTVSDHESIIDPGEGKFKDASMKNDQHGGTLNKESLNSSDSCSKSTIDVQEKLIITLGNKRSRDVHEKILNSGEPAQKKAKLDNETIDVETNEKISLSSDVISSESSLQVQNEVSHEHSKNETDKNNDLEKNTNDSRSNSKERVSTKENEVTLPLIKENGHGFTRVSDILKNIPSENSYVSAHRKNDDSTEMCKRYTRIALLRMREELNELTVGDSHHAHEYFVVNMFKVFYSLHTSRLQNSEEREHFKGLPIPLDLQPLKLNVANDVIQEINKFAIFPKDDTSYSDFKKNLPKNLPFNLSNMDEIYKFVRDKKELGASMQELIDKFENTLGEDLCRITSLLTEHRLFLRTGVTTVRYVHNRHVDSWLIHSCKIYRLEKESLIPIPKGAVYVTELEAAVNENNDVHMIEDIHENLSETVENESSVLVCKNPNESNIQSDLKGDQNVNSDKDTSSHSDEECNVQVKKRMQRKRTLLLPQRDISRAAKQLDFTTKKEIRVVIKPWIRIDGVLNRRVLDRMLGAVLSYCITHPGIALTKVQNRFVPALQPCHTRELVEMLAKIGCLETVILQKPRVTLFSKPSPIQPKVANNDWGAEEDIFLEPTTGAILKFGIFLSNKLYNIDFIA